MSFKTSVNIRFDIGKQEFLNRYIPTPSHTEALRGLLDGFVGSGNRSHIIIGAYGTGKSLLATIVSTIISKKATDIAKLENKFKLFDDEIAQKISQTGLLEKRFIPISLSGNEGRFREAIITSMVAALVSEDIDVILPGTIDKILKTVQMWEQEYYATFQLFEKNACERYSDLSEWENAIRLNDEQAIEWFYSIYPSLTAGATFDSNYSENFLLKLDYLVKIAKKNNLGFFLVYDEFGRFLQSLTPASINETMQDIQDLAEYVEREETLHFLLITHKGLRQYFARFQEDVAKEFQRVEKRFKQYNITSDKATFLKIAEVILLENIKNKPEVSLFDHEMMERYLRQYRMFPMLNLKDQEHLIINTLYPIHPTTLLVLPTLSNIFGQNERTLFTFLESNETGGLVNHIRKKSSYYLPHQLFDYFFVNTGENELSNELANQFTLYKKAISRYNVTKVDEELANACLKFITLWNLVDLTKTYPITNELLGFVLLADQKDLEYVLSQLQHYKSIRFNRLTNSWELNAGSAIDVEKIIKDRKKTSVLKRDFVKRLLIQNNETKYLFPSYFNDEKEMTRFAKVEIILDSDLIHLDKYRHLNEKIDLVIYYVISEKTEPSALIDKLDGRIKLDKELFVVHPLPLKTIQEELKTISIIHELLQDKKVLSEDKGVEEELNVLLEELNFSIKKFVSKLIEFDTTVIWKTRDEMRTVNSHQEISKWLSEICDKLYPLTPRIVNDSFNRMNVSSQQKTGAKQLIDSILATPKEEQFGVKGTGPAYAIYAAVFKNNNHFEQNVHTFDYKNIMYKPYKMLHERLINLLERKPQGNFEDIINVFTMSPFGIRQPVVPVLLVAMLRDRWSEFMLYRNDIFVPALNSEKLYEILEEEGPENYRYVYRKIPSYQLEFFNRIEEVFKDFREERLEGEEVSRLIQICGTLIKWYRSLPRYTQITKNVDKNYETLRTLIRQTEVKPQQSINKLYELFGEEISQLVIVKENAESLIEKLKEDIYTSFYELLQISPNEIEAWVLERERYRKSNELVNGLYQTVKVGAPLDQFIEYFSSVRIEDWSDKTFEKFVQDVKAALLELEPAEDGDGEILATSNIVSIKVGELEKVIPKVDFSVKSKTVYSNINRIIKQAGRNMSQSEIEYMIYLLLEEHIN